MSIVIALGSASAIKIAAVREAARRFGDAVEVIAIEADSGVNAQPVGDDETLHGARNRASAARIRHSDAWALGIENGIMREGNGWIDKAAAVLVSPRGEEHVAWSESVAFPTADVAEAAAAGFATTTVGAIIARRAGVAAGDPHSFVTGGRRPRQEVLAATIVTLFSLIRDEGPAGGRVMNTTHRIEIAGVVRELPVREVAPGVRVALFNILGDWELTEAAGTALAARLPAGIDALVMPDGKATALLHVMGRETGLPTFVARKEKKPYMADPVREVSYRSITTDRVQTLFLGADDADRLAGKRVVIVDDVVSTGGTVEAMKLLMAAVGADVAGTAAVLTEGGVRADVIALGDLPLF